MKKIFFIVLLTGLFILPSPCFGYERINPRGPMAIRNQMPLYLFWYAFPQEGAEVAGHKKFLATFDYTVSNVIVDKVTTPTEEYIVQMDMEVSRYNLNLRYGLLEQLEIAAEMPYLVLSKGYLDNFVENFERVVGATAVGARKRADKYKFNYNVRHNGKYLINRQEPVDGIGDLAVSAKYMLIEEMENTPRVSLRGAVKFPTASKNKYLGSGKFDYGFGVLMDKTFSRLVSYLNLSTTFIDKPDFLNEMDIKNYILSGMLGLEYCFTERLTAILQGTVHTSPYPTTGTDPLDNEAGEVALGLSYQFTMNSKWHIAVVENIWADSTPDVTFQLGGRVKF